MKMTLMNEWVDIEEYDDDNNDENDDIEPIQRRKRLNDRLVHDKESALDPDNYDCYVQPAQPVEVKVVTQKRTTDQEEVSVT